MLSSEATQRALSELRVARVQQSEQASEIHRLRAALSELRAEHVTLLEHVASAVRRAVSAEDRAEAAEARATFAESKSVTAKGLETPQILPQSPPQRTLIDSPATPAPLRIPLHRETPAEYHAYRAHEESLCGLPGECHVSAHIAARDLETTAAALHFRAKIARSIATHAAAAAAVKNEEESDATKSDILTSTEVNSELNSGAVSAASLARRGTAIVDWEELDRKHDELAAMVAGTKQSAAEEELSGRSTRNSLYQQHYRGGVHTATSRKEQAEKWRVEAASKFRAKVVRAKVEHERSMSPPTPEVRARIAPRSSAYQGHQGQSSSSVQMRFQAASSDGLLEPSSPSPCAETYHEFLVQRREAGEQQAIDARTFALAARIATEEQHYEKQTLLDMFTPTLAPPSASASASAPTPAIATASSVHETLHWASEFAKSDREVMAAACAIDGHALEFASDALKDDAGVVRVAVSSWGGALSLASEKIRGTKAVVLVAVKTNGRALAYASSRLLSDLDIAKAAVSSFVHAYEWLSPSAQADPEVCALAGKTFVQQRVKARAANEWSAAAAEAEQSRTKHRARR